MTLETKPSNVRLPITLKQRINGLARRNNISASDIIRLTLIHYIPEIEAGRFHLAAMDAIKPNKVA